MTLPKGRKSGGPVAPRAVPLSLPGANDDIAPFEGSAQYLQLGSGARGKVAAAPDINAVFRSAPSESPPGKPPRAPGPSPAAPNSAVRTSLQNFMPERQEPSAVQAAERGQLEQGAGKKGCTVQ